MKTRFLQREAVILILLIREEIDTDVRTDIQGYDIDDIADITGLSKEEIEQL